MIAPATRLAVRAAMPALSAGFFRLLFPSTCCYCGGAIDDGTMCRSCTHHFCGGLDDPVCNRCAGTLGPFLPTENGCKLCSRESFAFERVIRLGRYEGELASACLRIKHFGQIVLCGVLGDLLARERRLELAQMNADLVTAIPLHWRRRWRRGYDQAAVLAGSVARELGVPLQLGILRRRIHTEPQSQLVPTKRRKNMVGAFCVHRPAAVAGRTVLLIDDILTTGATCHQAARALRSAGAAKVFVAVVARGDHAPRPASPPA